MPQTLERLSASEMGSKHGQPDMQVDIRAGLSLYWTCVLNEEEVGCFSGQRGGMRILFVLKNTSTSYLKVGDETLKPWISWCPEIGRATSLYLGNE